MGAFRLVRLRPLLAAVAGLLAAAPVAWAQSGRLSGPDEVVLYVHPELKSARFVDPLVCALQRVLVAPVAVRELDLPIGPDLLLSRTQFDVSRIGERFRRATASEGTPLTFKHLLIPHDLKAEPYAYVFASRFGSEAEGYRVQVISTARLLPADSKRSEAEVTAQRVYKIILRSVAQHAGYLRSQGCVLAFPNSLEDLDRKSSRFCERDHAALVQAGILKAVESDECQAVAARQAPLAVAARLRSSPEARP